MIQGDLVTTTGGLSLAANPDMVLQKLFINGFSVVATMVAADSGGVP